MSKPIIEIENISKCYRIGANKDSYLSLRDEISKNIKRTSSSIWSLMSKGETSKSKNETDFWALRDVNFSIQQGEAVGIIGRNGAGKSTLLKILSQITPPTSGRITMRGRVASLLEVGTGFHPELTGRENIYLNGAILGMTRKEIKQKFDEIVDFSEVEKFLDTPVKRYSSGMYVRLAFAVAAHLEPEILVVDEVLAVGDAIFQKKCLGKMDQVAKGGRTVLFVSHNMTAVSSLCSKGILLRGGTVEMVGSVSKIIDIYQNQDYFRTSNLSLADRKDRSGLGSIKLIDIMLVDEKGMQLGSIPSGGVCRLLFKYETNKQVKYPQLSFTIRDVNGQYIYRPSSYDTGFDVEIWPENKFLICELPHINLIPGLYRITTEIRAGNEILDYIEGAFTLEVHESDFFGNGRINNHSPVLINQKWSFI
jgi:lipopolysaccharide transport system ATP-binding protein